MSVVIQVAPVSQFQPHGDGNTVAQRWKRWVRTFEVYASACGCKDEKQKRQLLLHSAGPLVQDIFETLTDTGEDFKTANEKLTAYFTPQKNVPYSRHVFRQENRKEGESVAEFVTRLRQLSIDCEFGNLTNDFIRDQVIDKCVSSSLRTKLLAEKDLKLEKLLDIAQAKEASESQSAQFGESEKAFSTRYRPKKDRKQHKNFDQKSGDKSKHSDGKDKDRKRKKGQCFRCGIEGHYAHECKCSKNVKCFKCGKIGHFAKMCKSEKVRYVNAEQHEENKNESVRYENKQECNVVQERKNESDSDYGFSCTADKLKTVSVKINGVVCKMIIDSGASCNIINTEIKEALISNGVKFTKSNRTIYPYCSLPIKASVETSVNIKHGNECVVADVICLEGNSPALLGRKTAESLRVLSLEKVYLTDTNVSNLNKLYPGIANGIGKFKGEDVKLHVDCSVPPVARKQVRIPFHMRKKVDAELDRLLKEDIIEEASGPSNWISPVVIVEKPKNPNEVRICVDMRDANKAILRTRHVTPTMDELICTLRDAKHFSKIDLRAGYHQLGLHPDSRAITTFATHRGLFRYKRLIFGVNAAAEIFQHTIQSVISDVEGAFNVSDDIIVFGHDQESHDKALQNTLRKLHENGLTINAQKCEFGQSKVIFYGHVFSSEGVSPDPEKVKGLHEAKTPESTSEVRSFLGMAQYSARFIPNFATITAPLRNLTKKDTKWQWTECEQNAFAEIKSTLSENAITAYFNPQQETTIYVDASPVGLAAILTQESKAIVYASRSLTAVESRYSQTEREALAVVWACEHFNVYVSGAPFTVVTDHEPLLGIWNKPNTRNLRITRWGLRLQPYHITLKYKPGKDNPADFMSRSPTPKTGNKQRASHVAEEYVNLVIRESKPRAISENRVREETSRDHTLQVVMELIKTRQWGTINKYKNHEQIDHSALQSFRSIQNELTISESDSGNIILRGTQIIIPYSLQKETIALAHEGHQGMSKTKAFIRSKVWFPRIDKMVEEAISKCIPCEANTNRQRYEPLQMSQLPRGPWLKLSIDFCGPTPTGDYLLVIIDEFSRYPIVYVVRSTSAESTLPLLDRTFSMFGYPETIKSDNGPPFQSYEWKTFLEERGIKHRRITPLWPQANAQAENFNKPLMKAVRAAIVNGQNWKQALVEFLRVYRTTPHSTTLFTPYRLLFGRNPRTKLPEVLDLSDRHADDDIVRARDDEQKQRMKEYADAKRDAKETPMERGDIVMIKRKRMNKTDTIRDAQPLTVSKTKGSMITAQYPNGKEVTRNKSFFRPVPNAPPEILVYEPEVEQVPYDNSRGNVNVETPVPSLAESRPRREVRKPKRLIEECKMLIIGK